MPKVFDSLSQCSYIYTPISLLSAPFGSCESFRHVFDNHSRRDVQIKIIARLMWLRDLFKGHLCIELDEVDGPNGIRP